LIVRGENVVFLGEIDLDHELNEAPKILKQLPGPELMKLHDAERAKREGRAKLRKQMNMPPPSTFDFLDD